MYEIYTLIEHLRQCPPDFLQESNLLDTQNGVDTNALILDLFREYSSSCISVIKALPEADTSIYTTDHLRAIHITVWFFSSPVFNRAQIPLQGIQSFMFEQLQDLSEYVKVDSWLKDEDRAEEFVRTALMACDILPYNETQIEAMDRLESISILKRNKVLSRSKKAFDRVMKIRKKMAEKKAREAANVYGRE